VQFDARYRSARQISMPGMLCQCENPLINGVFFQIGRLRLAKGAVPFDDVARHFHMSSKTLERRLSERGTGYRELVDAIRCDLAKHYLTDTDVRLQQIAYLLGYSEPAPLVRAFKRWTGCTPMQYRAKLR